MRDTASSREFAADAQLATSSISNSDPPGFDTPNGEPARPMLYDVYRLLSPTNTFKEGTANLDAFPRELYAKSRKAAPDTG